MSSSKLKKFNTMDSGQRSLLKKIMSQMNLGSFDLGGNSTFKAGQNFNRQMLDPNSQAYQNLEAPYRRQYQEETVPRIAEAFSAYDAQDSSAFRQSMGRSAEDLEMNIAGQKQSAMSNAAQSMLQYSQAPGNIYQSLINTALGSQSYGYQQVPGTKGWGPNLFGMMSNLGGQAAGQWGMNQMSQMNQPQANSQVQYSDVYNGLGG
jgi:hypothetical protein